MLNGGGERPIYLESIEDHTIETVMKGGPSSILLEIHSSPRGTPNEKGCEFEREGGGQISSNLSQEEGDLRLRYDGGFRRGGSSVLIHRTYNHPKKNNKKNSR